MNERIQALKKQAFVKGHWSENGERFIGDHIDMDKFAELIVKECVDAAEEAQADFYIVHNIKSRFGIEE